MIINIWLQKTGHAQYPLTCHTCIFTMSTVVDMQPIVRTQEKRSFSSSASQIIQYDVPCSLAKMGTWMGNCCSLVSKLLACNSCIISGPRIITHCVPPPAKPNLNSTLICRTATDETYRATRISWCNTCKVTHEHSLTLISVYTPRQVACCQAETTLTCYTRILVMTTVVIVDSIVTALQKRCFPSGAM